jgi:hypothetical protein
MPGGKTKRQPPTDITQRDTDEEKPRATRNDYASSLGSGELGMVVTGMILP